MSLRNGVPTALALILAMAGVHADADGAALFTQHCAVCHQVDGSGAPGLAPPLRGGHWARLGADRAYLPTVLINGLSGAIKVGGETFVGNMPPFGSQLDDTTLAAIATHVRSLQGAGDDKPFAVQEIQALRQVAGGPPQSRQRRIQLLGN